MQEVTKRFASLTMSRRRLITATVGTGVALSAMATFSRSATAADEHAGHGDHMMMHDDAAHHQPLIDAALACVNRGDVCLDHCFKLLGEGDTSMKTCVRTVSAMLPMYAALARFAALDAPRLKDLARVCIDVCSDCEAECRKHQDHHAACRACAESCADCIKECKVLIAG
ncbi:MAG: four-helix bundle copper-binding protein [Xanthobacteraceae bacterium]